MEIVVRDEILDNISSNTSNESSVSASNDPSLRGIQLTNSTSVIVTILWQWYLWWYLFIKTLKRLLCLAV